MRSRRFFDTERKTFDSSDRNGLAFVDEFLSFDVPIFTSNENLATRRQ